jgi:hypothetical protein
MHFLKDAVGSLSGEARIAGLIRCPAEALAPGGPGRTLCTQAELRDLERSPDGWIAPRLAGEAPKISEHTLISREAARRAGLLHDATGNSGPAIFEPFWLRYPARGEIVGATQPSSSNPLAPPPPLLFAQSMRPVAFSDPQLSFIARPISLLELGQLPDFSNSLADWAMGNELCTMPGLDSAYKNIHAVEACHKFEDAMGAVNVTHFAPLNREMWRHYHDLALTQMADCNAYAPIQQRFYGSEGVIPDTDTEVHECERLAMAYEMFAQHFLQDAWSMGHMWMAWGQATLSAFPADVELAAGGPFGPGSEPGRRAMIAGVVAATRGMVHGTKSLLVKTGRQLLGVGLNDLLIEGRGIADDPLNSGRYSTLTVDPISHTQTIHQFDVQWGDIPRTTLFRGAGDLFWDPFQVTGLVVSQDDEVAVQRERLLNCSAKSLLDVYEAGPHAHGGRGPAALELHDIDADSDDCWEHWATNASMAGSLSPFDLKYVASNPAVAFIALAANDMVIQNTSAAAEIAPDLIDKFKDRVKMRWFEDLHSIGQAYADNAKNDPNGYSSAHQNGFQGASSVSRMSLLGVPPVEATLVAGPPAGVSYVDRMPLPGDTGEAERALSGMFWRGDLRRTCGISGLDALKQACIQGAQHGGDAEACTACVALAEIHIPQCSTSASMGDSKCSAIGAENAFSGAPSWWYDASLRVVHTERLPEPFSTGERTFCEDAPQLALEWCTDTPFFNYGPSGMDGNWYNRALGPFRETEGATCGEGDERFERQWGTVDWRGARFLDELGADGPWIYPMAVAYDYSATMHPGQNPCNPLDDRRTTSRDGQLSSVIYPVFVSDYISGPGPTAEVPRCGLTQREFSSNRACDSTEFSLVPPNLPLGKFDEANGAALKEWLSPREQCLVREPRMYRPSCPAGLTCTAGGECVPSYRPPMSMVVLDPPGAHSFP